MLIDCVICSEWSTSSSGAPQQQQQQQLSVGTSGNWVGGTSGGPSFGQQQQQDSSGNMSGFGKNASTSSNTFRASMATR